MGITGDDQEHDNTKACLQAKVVDGLSWCLMATRSRTSRTENRKACLQAELAAGLRWNHEGDLMIGL